MEIMASTQFRILLAGSIALALLVAGNATLYTLNKGLQRDVAGRAQFVAQTGSQLEPVYRALTQGLAELSVRNNDAQLQGILAAQGITVSVKPRAQGFSLDEQRHESGAGRKTEKSTFLPFLIVLLVLIGWFAFQSVQLFEERGALSASREAQEPQVQNSSKLRASLDAMARETARLAKQGNANARLLIDELQKRGVTVNPDDNTASAAPVDK
jgi:hypothetical protein